MINLVKEFSMEMKHCESIELTKIVNRMIYDNYIQVSLSGHTFHSFNYGTIVVCAISVRVKRVLIVVVVSLHVNHNTTTIILLTIRINRVRFQYFLHTLHARLPYELMVYTTHYCIHETLSGAFYTFSIRSTNDIRVVQQTMINDSFSFSCNEHKTLE